MSKAEPFLVWCVVELVGRSNEKGYERKQQDLSWRTTRKQNHDDACQRGESKMKRAQVCNRRCNGQNRSCGISGTKTGAADRAHEQPGRHQESRTENRNGGCRIIKLTMVFGRGRLEGVKERTTSNE